MSYDHFAKLADQQACPHERGGTATSLVSGFVDECTSWFSQAELIADERDRNRRKNEARNCYMERAQPEPLQLPSQLDLALWPPAFLHQGWLALAVDFELLTPWYSKDDRPFHVLENPVRKDRVFGVPFMSAASWKGMLRWACRMQAGLLEDLEQGKQFEEWSHPDWVLHLFGNEKGEKENFHQGALVFYPTWFDRITFEVINPHSRKTRAGTQPIYYEVVPGRRPKQKSPNGYDEGGKGTLCLLYAPWPGMKTSLAAAEWLPNLLQAIEQLLTRYGISAKRTVGWGTAEIKVWRAWRNDPSGVRTVEASNRDDFLNRLNSGGAP